MARVVLVGNLVQLTGGAANFDLAATSVKHLFELLAERHPALAPHLAEGVAVAIDGQIYQDTLHEPIAPDSEVFVLVHHLEGPIEIAVGLRLRRTFPLRCEVHLYRRIRAGEYRRRDYDGCQTKPHITRVYSAPREG